MARIYRTKTDLRREGGSSKGDGRWGIQKRREKRIEVEGKWKEMEEMRREVRRIWKDREISVLRRTSGKAEWAIIDIKFREQEIERKWKGGKPESSREPLLLIKVIIPSSGAHTYWEEWIEKPIQLGGLKRRACVCACMFVHLSGIGIVGALSWMGLSCDVDTRGPWSVAALLLVWGATKRRWLNRYRRTKGKINRHRKNT